ncbi:MAG: restriction endonuclease subunit S [Porticoccaceae bacterium]
MIAGWESKPIGEVCTIKPPKAEARAKLADGDEVSFAPMEDLGISEKYLQPRRTRQLGEVSGSYTYFADGDVLLAKITPCFENGKLGVARGLTNGVGFGSSEYIVLRPAPALDAEFLYYYLARPTFLEEGARTMTGAVGHKRVTKEFVESYQIPLPPLAEQRRIVAILDEAFEGIATAKANAEKKLRSARELFDGYLRDVFRKPEPTWLQTVVDQHIRFIDYRGKTPQKTSEGLRLITAKNVKKGFIQEEPLEFVAPGSYESWMTRGIPKLGDVLFTTEAPLGNVAQLDTAERVVFAQRIIIMQPDPVALDSTFLKYLLLSEPMQAKLHAQATGATAQGIKASLLKRIPITFPKTLTEQAAIVERLDSLAEATSRLEDLYVAKLAALDELQKSLLHQAFTGALTAKSTDQQVAEVA